MPPPLNLVAAAVATTALNGLPTSPVAASPGQPAKPLTPDEVVQTVNRNATDPAALAVALKQAEADLKKYEADNGIQFAQLEIKDRERAGTFQVNAGISDLIFRRGIWIVWISMACLIVLAVSLMLVGIGVIPLKQSDVVTAAFGLIGTAVGFLNGLALTVVSFYWGSSQGSKEKTDALTTSIDKITTEFASRPAQAPAAPPTPPAAAQPAPTPAPSAPTMDVAQPAKKSLIIEVLPDLRKPHRQFADGVEWALTPEGIAVDGALTSSSSAGAPGTVADIWSKYGESCAKWARMYGAPVELIVATIATESAGKPDARRPEPGIGDESVGLMQTLVATARGALGQPSLRAEDLLDPDTSIRAGTAYIAQQRGSTHWDPVLVAAAYNAGSIRRDDGAQNRWRLLCYPKGTGHHIDKFVSWFGDAMRLSASGTWAGADGAVPSFAAAFATGGAPAEAARATAPGAPPAAPVAEKVSTAVPALAAFGDAALPLVALGEKLDLAKAIQQKLSEHGYLDPPPDGEFGEVSKWALRQFLIHNQIAPGDSITPEIVGALLAPRVALPVGRTGTWVDRVLDYMPQHGYWLCRVPACKNIVYLEGVSEDGTLNDDKPDVYNDLRMVIWFEADGSAKAQSWQATSEPGDYYTRNPLDPDGAARIAFGQYKSWIVGMHHADHEALVQAKPIDVCRDFNKDCKRTGDKVCTGIFGINQHWGYDVDPKSIGKTSAGCLVGRAKDGHREFMQLVKSDPRYQVANGYRFVTTVLPGDKVLGA